MRISDFLSLKWKEEESPLIQPPPGSPIIADPSFLGPEDTPDKRWHLFAHSIWRIHHYVSDNGVAWQKQELVVRHAMRAFVLKHNDTFYLYYERYRPFQILFTWITTIAWKSLIEVRTSKDLLTWSASRTVLAPTLPWHKSKYGNSVSNPCVLKSDTKFVLYYSASLTLVPDCGFCEPEYIGRAASDDPCGPFTPEEHPLISHNPEDEWCNLCAGSIKVLHLEDGFIGLQNGIYLDKGRSGSAILLLSSADGIHFKRAQNEPIIRPTSGWKRSHVYACDARYVKALDRFHLYFNARDNWHWTRGREVIGLAHSSK